MKSGLSTYCFWIILPRAKKSAIHYHGRPFKINKLSQLRMYNCISKVMNQRTKRASSVSLKSNKLIMSYSFQLGTEILAHLLGLLYIQSDYELDLVRSSLEFSSLPPLRSKTMRPQIFLFPSDPKLISTNCKMKVAKSR